MTDVEARQELGDSQPGAVLDLGSTGLFTFPESPGSDRWPALALAHRAVRSAAAVSVAWLDGERLDEAAVTRLGLGEVRLGSTLSPVGLATFAGTTDLVLDDGSDPGEAVADWGVGAGDPPTGRPSGSMALGALHGGGGFALRRVHNLTSGLRDLHHDLVAASHAKVEILLGVGSLSVARFARSSARSVVCALQGSCVARSSSFAPLALTAGEIAQLPEPARITGGVGSVNLIIVIDGPHQFDENIFRLRRATCHPRLRLDLPVHIDEPVRYYGSAAPTTAVDVVEAELAQLLSAADAPAFDAWWASRLESPIANPRQLPRTAVCRGRLPGGVGVVSEGDETVVVAAGGRLLGVARGTMPAFTRLVARDHVPIGEDALTAQFYGALAEHSLVEVATDHEAPSV